MRSTFPRRGWHVRRPESQETADGEGLGLGQEDEADWAGEKSSAAAHTSRLTHRKKNPPESEEE